MYQWLLNAVVVTFDFALLIYLTLESWLTKKRKKKKNKKLLEKFQKLSCYDRLRLIHIATQSITDGNSSEVHDKVLTQKPNQPTKKFAFCFVNGIKINPNSSGFK